MKHQNMTMYHEPRRVTDRAMLWKRCSLTAVPPKPSFPGLLKL